MCNGFAVKFGFVHQMEEVALQRSFSVSCLRDMTDSEELVENVFEISRDFHFEVPQERNTLKIRNIRGKYDIDRFLEEVAEFQQTMSLVRLINPPNGRPYAYIVFDSEKDAEAFIECTKAAANLKGKTILGGGIGKRDAHFAKPQGEKEVLAGFPDLSQSGSNTWQRVL